MHALKSSFSFLMKKKKCYTLKDYPLISLSFFLLMTMPWMYIAYDTKTYK